MTKRGIDLARDLVEEGQFFVSESEPSGVAPGHYDGVRLGGAYFDSFGVLQYQWEDMAVPSASDEYFVAGASGIWPATPKEGWNIMPTPSASSKFDSGVFARDSTDDAPLRIFTGHNVLVSSGGAEPEPEEQTEFRWYVIDPDLGNFPGTNWTPTIEVVGRAPAGSITNGETYQGGIAVNETGAAYITFTRSGDSGSGAWPSLIRASLSMNYTTVLTELNGASQAGPAFWYDEGSGPVGNLGSDYADIQADYLHCGFWAVGALVAPNENTPPAASEVRQTWVTEISITCTNAEMNGDGVVDETDLALYLEYHAAGDQRADMDRSGTITTADYQRYSDEYAKR